MTEYRVEQSIPQRLVGKRVLRVEDQRYLTGRGQFVDDVQLPGMLHVAFLRSPYAHARLQQVESSGAASHPGVVLVWSGMDIASQVRPLRTASTLPGYQATEQMPLALDRVRFMGEPVAVVVARDRYTAEDALEQIRVTYDPLSPVLDVEAAATGGPLVHDTFGTNVIVARELGGGDVDAAFAQADVVLQHTVRTGRQTGVPLETRGCVADYQPARGQLRLWSATQIPHLLRTLLAEVLGFPEQNVQVIAPDVGGGFGVKSLFYPEEVVCCLLARHCGCPVKWIEDRRENLLASLHSREQVYHITVAARRDGTISGLRATILVDVGAYSVQPWSAAIEPLTAAGLLPGPYKIAHYHCTTQGVLTTKCPVGPYRGVSRPAATLAMERTVDLVAARVGLDPAEVRQRNLVPPQDFPYTTPTRLVYDSASFTASFQRLLDMAEYPRLRQEQARARQQGRYLGIGLACYIELGAIGSASALAPGLLLRSGNDRATVRIEPSGTVTVLLGSASHGQSHETTFAQLVADTLGVDMHAIRVWHGNTAISPYGLGTFASRSAVMMGGAVLRSAQAVRQKVQRIAARLLEARPDDLVMQQGTVQVNGSPQRAMSLAEVAHVAYFQAQRLPPGEEPGLEACLSYDPVRGTVANGAHLAVVDVDIETGAVRILRYLVVEDCGTMLNPMVVEGQVHGGVSHGIGNALLAEMHYDEAGQLQTATLMDYLVPAATEVPDMHIDHLETPSPVTLGGMKGMGEGGTVGAVAAVVGAVADAVAPLGAVLTRIPLTPERLVEEIQKAGCIIVHQQNSARNA